MQTLTATEFAKTHRCDADWITAMGDRSVCVLEAGQKGTYAGFPAVVREHYCNGMYVLRLLSGVVCVDGNDFVH